MRALLMAACLAPLAAAPASIPTIPVSILHIPVSMTDGAKLCTNVFLPRAPGKFPTLLVRTPYRKGVGLTPYYEWFVRQGYALVIQDVRGRNHSSGEFQPLYQEARDGNDTLNWIVRQPWSSGGIGMLGASYLGIVQWRAATLRNPNLKAIFPVFSGGDEYLDRFYSPGGAMKVGHRLLWISENLRAPGFKPPDFSRFIRHIPLRSADLAAAGRRVEFFQTALNHPSYDGFWKSLSTRENLEHVRVPVFTIGGWYDNFVESDLRAFAKLSQRSPNHRIMIGPWAHSVGYKFKDVDFGPDAVVGLRQFQLAWFDRWLRPDTREVRNVPDAPVRIFVMGINQWRDEQEWPLARAVPTPMYLVSGGEANGLAGDGTLSWKSPRRNQPADHFVYDPGDPVPTTGGPVCCNPKLFPWGPMDQRKIETRPDVLVYTSDPFLEDIEVTGPIEVALHVATSAADTDFTAKLVDVAPNGFARNLCDGILRLRYRNGLERSVPATPGEIYQIRIDAGVTSNVFRSGHRIRVEISSSNFPRFDRNPNTGRPISSETQFLKASQTVFHDVNRPSYVVLPVVPASGAIAQKIDGKAVNELLSKRKNSLPAR